MNDSFEDFETELRGLNPPQPREALTGRISGNLDRSAIGTWICLGLPLAAAALIGILAVWLNFAPAEQPLEPSAIIAEAVETAELDGFRQVDHVQYLYGAREEDVIYLDDSSPVVPVRLFYLDRTVWENPVRQIAFETNVPREELILLPLEIY